MVVKHIRDAATIIMGASPQKDIKRFKQVYNDTGSIKQSALAAGYALNTAKQGITPLAKPIRSFILAKQRKLDKLANLGRSVDPQQQEDIARGAILANIAAGKDAAVQSIKLAGQDKRVSMWQSDIQTGVFIIEMPGHLAKSVQPQVLDSKDIPE